MPTVRVFRSVQASMAQRGKVQFGLKVRFYGSRDAGKVNVEPIFV
jgi:hypothetical protein